MVPGHKISHPAEELETSPGKRNIIARFLGRLVTYLRAYSHLSRVHEENAARYRAVLDTAVDAIIVANQQGKVQSFNRAAEQIFGYSAEEVIGRNISRFMPIGVRENHDGYLAHYRKTGERKIIGIGREVKGLRKDGIEVPLELSIAEWTDAKGARYFTGIMRDVTQRYQHEQELEKAREEAIQARRDAEAANQAKTDFLAVISHEIRTPLTSISGYADLLSNTQDLSADQSRYVELIRAANAALLTVVNDVLDFSKVQAGHMELEKQPFSPKALVHDTLAILRPMAEVKRLRLHYTLAPDVPLWLEGDCNRLRQILMNLLNNAIKFTSEGSIHVEMRLNEGERANIQFRVSDTGTGIPEDKQQRLFKRFSQADSSISRQYGGTGLGLAICKSLVELMDGDIGIKSSPGKGTQIRFNVHLPIAEAPTEIYRPRIGAMGQATSSERLLLVDDLDTNREIASAYLSRAGYDVDLAESAPKAIRMLQRQDYDLVLMDIQMPDMDGIAATRCIRSMGERIRNVPIIAMTGNVLPEQINAFIAAGMNDHVAKPINPDQLISSVKRWLDVDNPEPVQVNPSEKQDFEANRLAELIDLMGPDRVEATVRKFLVQLDTSFKSRKTREVRIEAHNLINTAGVLGFEHFAQLCRSIQSLGDDEQPESSLIACACEEKKHIQTIANETVLPQLRAAMQARASNVSLH